MALAMASCKLPSLVWRGGLRTSSAGLSSGLSLVPCSSRQCRPSRRAEHPRLAIRSSVELREERSAVPRNEGEFSRSCDVLECREQGEGKQIAGGEGRNARSSSEFTLFGLAPMLVVPAIAENAGYSQASYYTTLGLFVISVPGVWSLVKRSTKSKIVKKTFVVPGPNGEKGKLPSQIAGEITSSLARNNFSVADRGEVVTFEGVMKPSRGQAAFLSFCTAVSLGCVALVLSITAPDIGQNWYYLTFLSPLAGLYYWTRASRKEEIKVKMVVSDDETSTDVILQGDDEQIDRLRRELELMEKGMVYVKGLFEK